MDPERKLVDGKYRVEGVLGRGGMGLVEVAVHEQLGRRVAIKTLLPEAMRDPVVVERFLREARAAVQLRSEHVARVIDVGSHGDGTPFIVMEYLEGRDLEAQLLESGPLPPELAVQCVLQACEAIAEAHSLGIVHRDLKPSNLFLTGRPDGSPLVKVLDFGISKATHPGGAMQLTRTTSLVGSPVYMSPEQLRSTREVDARTDIWSLGVVLYQLVTAKLPFESESFAELCIKIATEPVPSLQVPGVPAALEAVIARCLEKVPERRFVDVAELAAALAPLADDRSRAAAVRIARLQGAEVPVRRARPAVIGAIAALVLIAGTVALVARQRSGATATPGAPPAATPGAADRESAAEVMVQPLPSPPIDAPDAGTAGLAAEPPAGTERAATTRRGPAARPRPPRPATNPRPPGEQVDADLYGSRK